MNIIVKKKIQNVSKYKYNLLKIFMLILICGEKKLLFLPKKAEPKMLANYCNIIVNKKFKNGKIRKKLTQVDNN